MSKRRSEDINDNSGRLSPTLKNTKICLNATELLIKKLKERKTSYNKFLSQIESFIEYAGDQAKNNDNIQLRNNYLEIIEEEESLRDKIREYLKKNDELIESIKKSNFYSKS